MGIRVIICKVGEAPEVTEIECGLDAMQAIVGGSIECVRLGDYIDLWCNEEGLFCCEPNRLIGSRPGGPRGPLPIRGDFFLARYTPEGKTVSLTDADVAKWLPYIADTPKAITSL